MVARVADGDDAAPAEIYDQCSGSVYRLVLRGTGHRQIAQTPAVTPSPTMS